MSESDSTDSTLGNDSEPLGLIRIIKVFQYNAHKARDVHYRIPNDQALADFQLLFIVEPYTYTLNDRPASTLQKQQHWRLIQPPRSIGQPPPRSVIYVNTQIPSSAYQVIASPDDSHDITAVKLLATPSSPALLFINVYNPPDTFRSLQQLSTYIRLLRATHHDAEFVVLGHFNLHHPLWDPPRRLSRHEPESEELLAIMASIDAQLQSQPQVPTFCNTRLYQSTIDLVSTLRFQTPDPPLKQPRPSAGTTPAHSLTYKTPSFKPASHISH